MRKSYCKWELCIFLKLIVVIGLFCKKFKGENIVYKIFNEPIVRLTVQKFMNK